MPSLLRPILLGLVALTTLLAPVALGQDRQLTNNELLDDFRHFVITRQDTLAEATGAALIGRGLTPEEFVGLVEDSRFGVEGFENAIRKGLFIDGVESIAAQLEQLYQQGRKDKARNPDDIARNINLLAGNQRGRILARQRLQFAGEYATPQLMQVLVAKSNPALEAEVERVLVSMGADAVAPLSAALLKVDPVLQERLAGILGRTQHPAALAPLYELAYSTESSAARAAAERAISRISGAFNPNLQLSDLYLLLAEDYYDHSRSLTRFPEELHQLDWTFDPAIGLFATPIRTEVFHETRAMRLAEKSLELDPTNNRAVSLWIAANFSREIDSPEGYENPVYASDRRDALYFAVAAGPRVTQDVLARALGDRDTPLARRAIQALRRSAGGAGLWEGLGGSKPLLDALSYPDRRVQYEAALALGAANPVEPFPGADRVTPLLASAIRDASSRFAVVISTSIDRQQALASLLRDEGYEILPPAPSVESASAAIADAPGVDLLVVSGLTTLVDNTIAAARAHTKLRATPVLGILPATGWSELHFRFENDPLTEVRRDGVSDDQIIESTRQLVLEGAGPLISEEEARRYALDALAVLRDLAISGSSSLSVGDAALPLIGALESTDGEVQLEVADVLARIGQRRAQIALMEAALDADGDAQVLLLEKVTRSAKAFGNMLERRHVQRLVELTSNEDTNVATAAAALMGALNLQGGEILDLILVAR